MMYSFGGLMRQGSETGELLPPGATQEELFACSVGPDLNSITAQACLKELRDVRGCLYLHYDGVRYADAIESHIGTKLSWGRLESKRACRIAAYTAGTVELPAEELAELKEWALQTFGRFREAFADRIKAL